MQSNVCFSFYGWVCGTDTRKKWYLMPPCLTLSIIGGALGVMVIVVVNGHGDTSLNPGRDWLHFT